jgi:two-component system, OmpR family, phosphate regulon sensor histidine kinase PhoR
MKNNRTNQVKNPLRKILLILVIIVLMPALFYSSLELSSLDEDEEMIFRIYEQQLDVVLFSINQYIWDYINSWKNEIEAKLSTKAADQEVVEFSQILGKNLSLKYVMVTDTFLTEPQVHSLEEFSQTQVEKDLTNLVSPEKLIRRLIRYDNAGYQKIESIILRGSEATGDERMILVSLTNSGKVIFMMVEFRPFIEEVIVPKLQEIASENLVIGVFTVDTHEAVYQNDTFSFAESQMSKKLWLFPDYLVSIRSRGKSLEELARGRFYEALVYNSILLLTLLIGAFIIFRNIRKEVQLAQMKSDFVSNVSHELRTPLALIRMYAETLEMDRIKTDEKRKEYYQIIYKESERLTRLINNILNFSRIESGRKEYNFQYSDLNDIIQETLNVYSYHIKNRGFELDINLQDELLGINADVESITECIINLLDNAVKYSKEDKHIKISTGKVAKGVYVEVSDKGIGINQKELTHIFEKFYRVSSGPVHNTKGSGLGLTLVQHIVHAHSGEIKVESNPGEGTTFRLIFPTANKLAL